jgi:hypothetical protein
MTKNKFTTSYFFPLKSEGRVLKLNLVTKMLRFGLGALVLFSACFVQAAPDFKIRYNQKFPCLEVMDSKAVKITDVTEGAKGETVTSGKASLNISFVKNADGLPEVTLREAKSPLSEMEIEAFGLSVGLKPEGTVLVRFGADNKPKFEMDRTGGSRFLMADLGNLDTAAGKEVANNGAPSKNLIRCRERLADWIAGKGGWSNKSGKILGTEGDDMVKVGDIPNRTIQVGEAFQNGATITVGSKGPLLWQSGAGVFHLALPGTVFSVGKLETGSPDLKVELIQGTLQTFVAEPLKTPRTSLIGVGDGVVARTSDASYQMSRAFGKGGTTTLTSVSGKVILAQEAGGKEVASVTGEQILDWPKNSSSRALAKNSPEKSSLVALQELSKETVLIDIARDGVKACPEAAEEIVSTAVKANPALARKIAEQCLRAQPKLVSIIALASGITDLKLSNEEQAKVDALQMLDRRLAQIQQDGIDLEMKLGQVLFVEGEVRINGRQETLNAGQVLVLQDKITTSKGGRVFVGMAPGVVLSVEPESTATLEKMDTEIKEGQLQSRSAIVNSETGLVVMSIAPWNKEKTDVRVKTKEGESVAQGTVFAVNFQGGKMMTTVSRGQVSSTDASGKSVSISAGQQASPGAEAAVATPANSPEARAASNVAETASHALAANVAATVAAALPTAAGEIAAIAAKAIPGAAEKIAGAVAAKAPAAAMEIAQAVAKAVPEAAAKVAAAVIAAAPGADSKAITSATASTAKAAAEAPAVDTAAGTETAAGGGGAAAGGGGGAGAGGGSIGGGSTVQQVADNNAQALAEARKAQEAAEAALKAAKTDAEKKAALDALNAAKANVAAKEAAVQASAVAAAEAAAKAAAATAAKTAADKLKSDMNSATSKDAAYDLAATANDKAQDNLNTARDAATQAAADAAAAAAAADAQLAAENAAKALSASIANATTKDQAVALANTAATTANNNANSTKAAQESLALELVAKQKAETEATAAAQAAQAAAIAAAKLQADLAAATTKAAQEAAAKAASDVAAAQAAAAAQASAAAATAAANAKNSSTSTFNSLTSANQSLANQYMASSPAATETVTASVRSIRAIFTDAQLNANPTLKDFVTKWDAYIEAQQAKFAAAAEQAEKAAAATRASQMEAAIKAADFAAAKTAADTLIQAAKDAATAKEAARVAAEAEAKAKAIAEAQAQAAREVAAAAKAAADKLAADIAAADLATAKAAAVAAAVAKETERKAAEVAEAAKAVAAAAAEASRLAAIQAAANAEKLAQDIAAATSLAAAKAQADAAATAASTAAAAEAAAKAIADAKKAADDAAKAAADKAAEDAAKNVPVVDGGTKPPDATPT